MASFAVPGIGMEHAVFEIIRPRVGRGGWRFAGRSSRSPQLATREREARAIGAGGVQDWQVARQILQQLLLYYTAACDVLVLQSLGWPERGELSARTQGCCCEHYVAIKTPTSSDEQGLGVVSASRFGS